MKSLKIALLVALSAFFAGSFLQAQPPEKGQGRKGGGGRGMTAEAQVARLDEALALTADQKTKITAIFAKVQEKIQALPQEERMAKGQELRTAANKEVRALLTPEQQAKFDAMPPPGRGGGGGRGKKQN